MGCFYFYIYVLKKDHIPVPDKKTNKEKREFQLSLHFPKETKKSLDLCTGNHWHEDFCSHCKDSGCDGKL